MIPNGKSFPFLCQHFKLLEKYIFFIEGDRRIDPFLVGKWFSFSISRPAVLYPAEKQNTAELHVEALESNSTGSGSVTSNLVTLSQLFSVSVP